MKNDTTTSIQMPEASTKDVLTEVLRGGAREMPGKAIEATINLARGIAHDFTNLLTSATGILSLLERSVTDAKNRKRVAAASRTCWQAAALASRLLNFANIDEGHPQVFRLGEVVELILSSLDEVLLGGIDVCCDCDESAVVRIDRDQLTQVILNLIRNACDAMPDGGKLRIKAEFATDRHLGGTQPARKHVVLSVADSGCGMAPEIRRRIFEPFFTTKARSAHHGRGMGLVVVYAAVSNADGFIRVDSQVGVGTEFHVFLPAEEGAPVPVEDPVSTGQLEAGTGTILLVEDDRSMLHTCTEALEEWGYSVITADCVSDAQSIGAEVRRREVDLAVIDADLPDGGGLAFAGELLSANPRLPLIFTTSFEETEIPKELTPQVCARLVKPFRFDVLARTVAHALSQQPAGH